MAREHHTVNKKGKAMIEIRVYLDIKTVGGSSEKTCQLITYPPFSLASRVFHYADTGEPDQDEGKCFRLALADFLTKAQDRMGSYFGDFILKIDPHKSTSP